METTGREEQTAPFSMLPSAGQPANAPSPCSCAGSSVRTLPGMQHQAHLVPTAWGLRFSVCMSTVLGA